MEIFCRADICQLKLLKTIEERKQAALLPLRHSVAFSIIPSWHSNALRRL